MLSSRLLKLLLLFALIMSVYGQTDTDSVDTTDSGDDTDTDSDDDTSDSMDVTGDSDDDSDDDDSDDDDSDDDDSDSDSDDDDSDDDDSDTDSDDDDSDDDDSDTDSDDDDSDDTDSDDTDSDDDSDDTDSDDTDSSDTDGSGSSTATTASSVSYCASLSQNQCANAYADNGQAICAMNAVSDSCYAVVAQKGMYGSGNYDDGYSAAAQEMEQESQKLNAIVGVLAAIVVLLVLALLGGGYFLYQKTKKMSQIAEESQLTRTVDGDDKEVDEPMVTGHHTIYTN